MRLATAVFLNLALRWGGGLSSNSPTNPQGFPQTGDIILAGSEPPKRKKKKIIIGLSLGIIISISVIAVLINMIGAQSERPILEKFDIFLNYILYGEDSDEEVLRGNTLGATIRTGFQEDQPEYFNKLENLYNDFYSSYDRERDRYNEWQQYIIDKNKLEFDFVVDLKEVGFLDLDTLVAMFLEKEDIATREADRLKAFDGELSEVDEYIRNRTKYVSVYARYLEKMNAAGCVVDGMLDEICSDIQPLEENSNPRAATNKKLLESIRKSENNAISIFIASCFDVREILVKVMGAPQ